MDIYDGTDDNEGSEVAPRLAWLGEGICLVCNLRSQYRNLNNCSNKAVLQLEAINVNPCL